MPEFDERAFKAALAPLQPYLDQVVLCGGWTLAIYRKWFLKDGGPLPLATSDLDVAVPHRLRVAGRPLDELLQEAGFKPSFSGMEYPSISYIKEGVPEIEFLTPRKGDRPPKPIEVQKGLKAESLRFIELILENTRSVSVGGGSKVRVPTPEAYLYQKGLTFHRRTGGMKSGKDLAYMFELLNNYSPLSDTVLRDFRALAGEYPSKWCQTFRNSLEKMFPAKTLGEGPKMVARQAPHPYAEMVREDPTNGPELFKQLVHEQFRRVIQAAE